MDVLVQAAEPMHEPLSDPVEVGERGSKVLGDAFEALSDPNRRVILGLLGSRERSVSELAGEMPISRPAVSRHLRLLKEAGLVAERPRGTRRIYRLQEQGLEAVQAYLEQVWGDVGARLRLMADNASLSEAER